MALALDTDGDAVELAIKLEYSQRRLEECHTLIAQLRVTMGTLIVGRPAVLITTWPEPIANVIVPPPS